MTDYQRYQLQWMLAHGYSLDDLIAELTLLQYSDPEDIKYISSPVKKIYKDWVADIGFGSEIWACKEEWQEYEGQKGGCVE